MKKIMFVFIAIMFACMSCECEDYDTRCKGAMIQERCSNKNSEWYDYHDCSTEGKTCAIVNGDAQCVSKDFSGATEKEIGIGELIVSTHVQNGGWVIYSCPAEEGESPSPIYQGPPAPHTGHEQTPYTLPASMEGVCYYIAFMPNAGFDVPPAQTEYLKSKKTIHVVGEYTPMM